MAEELLVNMQGQILQDGKNIPLVVIRPTIIAAAHNEPFPGWTDSLGLMSGMYAIAGHGILRDLPINPQLIGDQVPVDFVSNQLLAAQAYHVLQFRESGGKSNLLITHCSSSASNGVTWGDVIKIMIDYF